METSVERLEGNEVRLTVTVPAKEVDAAIESVYREFASRLHVPGFRKGRVPKPIIDTHVGRETILAEAQERIVERSYPRAIDAEGLRPIEPPDTGEMELVEPGQPYTYTARVVVRPELTLSSLDDLVVAAGPATTSDREIDAQIEYQRERFATLETVERPLERGDFALISFVGTVDGESYENNRVDHYLYETGRGLMPEEFDAALAGASAGDTVVAEFTVPEGSAEPDFVGKTARFEIEVHEVKGKVLPALDDEFAKMAGGFDALEEMREDLRRKLDAAKATGRAQRIELLARQLIASRLEGEVPESMVRSRADSLTRDFFQTLDERGISLADYVAMTGVTPEQIQADIRRQAEVRVREELALEALFRAKGMTITDEEMHAALLEFAGGDESRLEETRERLAEAGATPIVREGIMHEKALAWLLANITVTEDEEHPAGEAAPPGDAATGASKPKRVRKRKSDASKEE